MVGNKSGEEICLFVRDEQTGRLLFNAKALQALGINPVEAQQRGYPMKERSALAERRESRNHSQRGRGLRRQPGDVLCFRQGKHHIGLTRLTTC
jgi:hypothetical protein